MPQVQIQLLRLNPIFAPLPAPELEGLARALVPLRVAAGTTVIREGDEGDRFYAIADGEVRVTKRGVDVATLRRGSGFGEIALIEDVPRTATVVAVTDAQLFSLEKQPFVLGTDRSRPCRARRERRGHAAARRARGAVMDAPTTRYAKAADGCYLAYQVFGDGPVDLLYVAGWHSHLEVYWEQPLYASFMRRLARSFRVITFDKRGTGLSERNIGVVDFETMIDDVRTVLDAAESRRPVLWGDGTDGGGSCAVFSASFPDRVLALVWWRACARTIATPDYPWGQTTDAFTADDDFIARAWGDEREGDELMAFVGCPFSVRRPRGPQVDREVLPLRRNAERGRCLP